jgi:hypothetical protein
MPLADQGASMRLIYQVVSNPLSTPVLEALKAAGKPHAHRMTKVYRNAFDNFYVVKLYVDGTHHEPADYETDDKQDAINTANAMVK